MELLVFGHGGAPTVVFPTSSGRFFDWENRGMVNTLAGHIENGWVQLYCVDSVDNESWYNKSIDPRDRAHRHVQYQDYVAHEVLPFVHSKNENPFKIAMGASFGGYHAVNIALRYPDLFKRAIGMSGLYDLSEWTNGQDSEAIFLSNPCKYVQWLCDNGQLERIKNVDLIIPIGEHDQNVDNNRYFSELLWNRGIWHALRVWQGNAHDWPYWQEMVLNYIGGVDSRG